MLEEHYTATSSRFPPDVVPPYLLLKEEKCHANGSGPPSSYPSHCNPKDGLFSDTDSSPARQEQKYPTAHHSGATSTWVMDTAGDPADRRTHPSHQQVLTSTCGCVVFFLLPLLHTHHTSRSIQSPRSPPPVPPAPAHSFPPCLPSRPHSLSSIADRVSKTPVSVCLSRLCSLCRFLANNPRSVIHQGSRDPPLACQDPGGPLLPSSPPQTALCPPWV